MLTMRAESGYRLLLCAIATIDVVSVGVFAGFAWRDRNEIRESAPPMKRVERPYVPGFAEPETKSGGGWHPPPSQTRGSEWLFDLFTPPEIFYHAHTQQFAVIPPVTEDELSEEAFGLDLVAVRAEPFRLQLIGHVGGDGTWRGMFENLSSGEVFLAAAGRRVPGLAISILSLEVEPQSVALPEGMTTRQRMAVAVVRDEQAGRDLILTQRDRQFAGTFSAVVAATGETATREVRVGEAIELGPATYRIERIRAAPAALEVSKERPAPAPPVRRTLVPRAGAGVFVEAERT